LNTTGILTEAAHGAELINAGGERICPEVRVSYMPLPD
jgi:hypothetical protein